MTIERRLKKINLPNEMCGCYLWHQTRRGGGCGRGDLRPVRCQPGGDVAPRDLCHDVPPEKRAVDHPHGLRVPVKLGFLVENRRKKWFRMNENWRRKRDSADFYLGKSQNVYIYFIKRSDVNKTLLIRWLKHHILKTSLEKQLNHLIKRF